MLDRTSSHATHLGDLLASQQDAHNHAPVTRPHPRYRAASQVSRRTWHRGWCTPVHKAERELKKKYARNFFVTVVLFLLCFFYYREVTDESDGCGAKFSVLIVSDKFQGKALLARHRLVNTVLQEELKSIHAFTQKTLTVEQWEKQKS